MGGDSSESDTTDDYDTDDELRRVRGRRESHHALSNGVARAVKAKPILTRAGQSGHGTSSTHSGGSRRSSPTRVPGREPFTRSRSPVVHLPSMANGFTLPHRTASPSMFSRSRHAVLPRVQALLPGTINISFRVPFSKATWMVLIDVRQAMENILLLCSLGYAAEKLRANAGAAFSPDMWASIGSNSRLFLSNSPSLTPIEQRLLF